MHIQIQLTHEIIRPEAIRLRFSDGRCGALVEFTGSVRAEENGRTIAALEYEAYDEMAQRVMRQICESLAAAKDCDAVAIVHRVGIIPVGEAAIYICASSKHRAEGFAMVTGFMDRLKQDVPIWKRRSLTADELGPQIA